MSPYQIADTLFDIIKSNSANLSIPSEYHTKDYFQDAVKSKLNSYYDLLSNNNVGVLLNKVPWKDTANNNIQFLNRVLAFKNTIINSIALYYEGQIADSFVKFINSLETVVQFHSNIAVTAIEPNQKFYRIRRDSTTILKNRDENFHIRFDLRHYCATQRYSIPGIPSLYVGDSAFICYQEVGIPPLSESYISKFVATEMIRIITIQTIDDFIDQYQNEQNIDLKLTRVLRFMLLYPLYVATTIKVQNTDGAFKPEYIVPQMLMQYVTKNRELIKGIKFPSTKINPANRYDNLNTYNYVFPVEKSKKDGFCDYLSRSFELTKPTNMQTLLSQDAIVTGTKDYDKSDYRTVELELDKLSLDNVLN